jgi:hypothetical protein
MLSRGASRRGAVLAVAASLVAGLLAGCGEEDESAPPACLAPATAYLDALKAAPDPVVLDDSTPISDCLVEDQEPAELGQVGEGLVGAATRLNAEARRDPSGDATVELGYLIGAVQQGAADSGATESGGIHTDLLRRLDSAARFNKGGEQLPASFERAFGEGYAAGQDSG